jgi:hypothetical protein
VHFRYRSALLVTTVLLAHPLASAHAEGPAPAVSTLNGKLSTEGGVTGGGGQSSGIGVASGSITTPLGHPFGLQVDGTAGTAFNGFFGGGTAHLFWRDPAIGLFGPVASLKGGSGVRAGWYGAEAELYAGIFTFGAWGGYHDVVDSQIGATTSSGSYAGHLTVYPTSDVAVTLGAGSQFSRAHAFGKVEFQPGLFACRNIAFFVSGGVAQPSQYGVTAGIRIYFGPDKPLIRRHREDDPDEVSLAVSQLFSSYGGQYASLAAQAQALHDQFVTALQGAGNVYAEP